MSADAPAGAIAEHAADHAAEDHPERRCRRRVGKRRAREVPLPHHRRDGVGKKLIVEPVEHDHQRRAGNEPLLKPAERSVVYERRNVNGLHRSG